MARYGYTMMCEQSGPKALVEDAVAAESVGFEFAVMSDHYFPWLDDMGHSPYAWSVLGAVAQVTSDIDLMTYVTCPAQALSPGRGSPKGGHHLPDVRRALHARPWCG